MNDVDNVIGNNIRSEWNCDILYNMWLIILVQYFKISLYTSLYEVSYICEVKW